MLETKDLQTDITKKTLRVEHKSQPQKQDDLVDILYIQKNIDRQIWQERKEIAEAIKLMIEQQTAESKVKKTWQQVVYNYEDIFKIDSFKILRREEWKRAMKKIQTTQSGPLIAAPSNMYTIAQNFIQRTKTQQQVKFAPVLEEQKDSSPNAALLNQSISGSQKSPPKRRVTLSISSLKPSLIQNLQHTQGANTSKERDTLSSPTAEPPPLFEDDPGSETETPSKPPKLNLESFKKKALALALTKVASMSTINLQQQQQQGRMRRVSQFSGSSAPPGPFQEVGPLLKEGWRVGPFVVRSEDQIQQYDGYRTTKLVDVTH